MKGLKSFTVIFGFICIMVGGAALDSENQILPLCLILIGSVFFGITFLIERYWYAE